MTLANKNSSLSRIAFQQCLIITADMSEEITGRAECVGPSGTRRNVKQSGPRQCLQPGQGRGWKPVTWPDEEGSGPKSGPILAT